MNNSMTPSHKAGEPQQDPEGTVPALPPARLQIHSYLDTAIESLTDGGQGAKALALKNIRKAQAALSSLPQPTGDAARLDWLESTKTSHDSRLCNVDFSWRSGMSLRSAIDAAMTKETPK